MELEEKLANEEGVKDGSATGEVEPNSEMDHLSLEVPEQLDDELQHEWVGFGGWASDEQSQGDSSSGAG